MTSKRGRKGGGTGAASTSSSSFAFTPLSDLVPASIPYTEAAQRTLESLRAGQNPGLDALLAALNCGEACEAAGAPYSSKCSCRAAAGVAASSSSSSSSSAAAAAAARCGGAAPRCVRGLAPPPGSHRKAGLWAKPPKKAEEEEEVGATGGGEGKEKDEVRKMKREPVLFIS